jgi:hypothetical protein
MDFFKIYAWLDEMAAANPSEVSVEVIGKSFEGRDMKVLKIQKPSPGGDPKMEVFIEASKYYIDSCHHSHLV